MDGDHSIYKEERAQNTEFSGDGLKREGTSIG